MKLLLSSLALLLLTGCSSTGFYVTNYDDIDGDGWSIKEGDCNDGNWMMYPGSINSMCNCDIDTPMIQRNKFCFEEFYASIDKPKPSLYERKHHEVCGSIMDQECTIRFLKEHNDYSCDGDLCCGGNSIGWYQCF